MSIIYSRILLIFIRNGILLLFLSGLWGIFITNGKEITLHNYRKTVDTVSFNIQLPDNSGAEVVWQLKNKATGKNWSQITGDRHGATRINIDGMEKDIHSYKAIIDSERIEYIHGKFING